MKDDLEKKRPEQIDPPAGDVTTDDDSDDGSEVETDLGDDDADDDEPAP